MTTRRDGWTVTWEPTGRVNVELLRKVLEFITEHPDEWEQAEWLSRSTCGTAGCVAGWAVVMDGQEIEWEPDVLDNGLTGYRASGTKQGLRIDDAAREALGLTPFEASEMFMAYNDLPYLWHLAREFTGGEIEPPEELREQVKAYTGP